MTFEQDYGQQEPVSVDCCHHNHNGSPKQIAESLPEKIENVRSAWDSEKTEKAQSRKATEITIVVPPVPGAWEKQQLATCRCSCPEHSHADGSRRNKTPGCVQVTITRKTSRFSKSEDLKPRTACSDPYEDTLTVGRNFRPVA